MATLGQLFLSETELHVAETTLHMQRQQVDQSPPTEKQVKRTNLSMLRAEAWTQVSATKNVQSKRSRLAMLACNATPTHKGFSKL
jgi:hypothetical protein